MKNFKTAVDQYRLGKITRREFLKETGIYIVKYPHFLGYHDDDIRHEFYAFIASKLDGIIKKYDNVRDISFLGWFNKVLKNQFMSFMKSQKTKKICEQQLESCFADADLFEAVEKKENVLQIDLSDLTDNERKIIFLKYGFDASTSAHSFINEKIERKIFLEDRLTRKYIKLLKIQKAIINEIDPVKKKELVIEELALKRSKRKIEKVVKSLSLNLPVTLIEKESGITVRTVATYISRAKKKIREKGLKNIIVQ
jgi:DNA-directed RNA polymerase specialized sigma24 family protein